MCVVCLFFWCVVNEKTLLILTGENESSLCEISFGFMLLRCLCGAFGTATTFAADPMKILTLVLKLSVQCSKTNGHEALESYRP